MNSLFVIIALLSSAACLSQAATFDSTWCLNGTGLPIDYTTSGCQALGMVLAPISNTYSPNLFCREFTNQSCLATMFDGQVKTNLVSALEFFGNHSCYDNIRLLQCAWSVSPCQTKAALWLPNGSSGIYNMTFFVAPTLAQALYDSCKGICISSMMGGFPTTIDGAFNQLSMPALARYSVLLNMFSSSADPSYVPDTTHPRTAFAIGPSPVTGAMFNDPDMAVAAPEDKVGCDSQCSTGVVKSPRTLPFCAWYSSPSQSCCMPSEEMALGLEVKARVPPLFGTDCCYTNLAHLHCAWLCAGNNTGFVAWQGATMATKTMTVYVSEQTATDIYNSCKGHAMSVSGCRTIGQMYTAANFLSQLDSVHDPTYVPSATRHNVVYVVGANPTTGMSLSEPMMAGCGADLTGCNDGLSDDAASFVPFSALIFLFIAVLFSSL